MNAKRTVAALLPICLALSAFPAGAQNEALVVGGSGVAEDITGGIYDTLACATASVPAASVGSSWNCAATCSAEINHESGTGFGQLAITDKGVVVAASERTFEINDNPGINDLSPLVIATTARTTMSTASDPDTFCCAAKEDTGSSDPGNFDAGDSSISVVCTDL